jgi:hypothetical protein
MLAQLEPSTIQLFDHSPTQKPSILLSNHPLLRLDNRTTINPCRYQHSAFQPNFRHPTFQIQPSNHPTIQPSNHPTILSFNNSTNQQPTIKPFNHPNFKQSPGIQRKPYNHPIIESLDGLTFQPTPIYLSAIQPPKQLSSHNTIKLCNHPNDQSSNLTNHPMII